MAEEGDKATLWGTPVGQRYENGEPQLALAVPVAGAQMGAVSGPMLASAPPLSAGAPAPEISVATPQPVLPIAGPSAPSQSAPSLAPAQPPALSPSSPP